MAEAKRSCSAATGISGSRGEQDLELADIPMENKTVSGHLKRETYSSRSCPWGMELDLLWCGAAECFLL